MMYKQEKWQHGDSSPRMLKSLDVNDSNVTKTAKDYGLECQHIIRWRTLQAEILSIYMSPRQLK